MIGDRGEYLLSAALRLWFCLRRVECFIVLQTFQTVQSKYAVTGNRGQTKMAVSFQTKITGDVCVLSPEGKIVIGEEVGALREKIREILDGGNKNILINLSNVTYIDSTGVGALVGSFTTIRNQGGQMKLSNLSQRVRDILLVTKLLTVFDVYENEADGAKSFAARK